MSKKVQRILVILFMVAVAVYTLYNYHSGRTELSTMVVLLVFLGWMLFGQVYALVREWKDD